MPIIKIISTHPYKLIKPMRISKTNIKSLLGICILIIGISSCTPIKKGQYAAGSGTIFCDDGFRTILEEEIDVFEYTYPE